MPEIYGYSFCGEQYSGRYATRAEALEAAKDDDPEQGHCLTCLGRDIEPHRYLPDGDDLIERVEEGIADNHANEDAIFKATAEQRADLEARIQRAFQEWMEAHPNAWRQYYEADEIQEHRWPVEESQSVGAVDPQGGESNG